MGAIPVKKSKGDSIQWIQCDEESAQKLLQQENHLAVERIMIDLGDHFSKNGLGCSIWKGPPERPGIYVQSIKSQVCTTQWARKLKKVQAKKLVKSNKLISRKSF